MEDPAIEILNVSKVYKLYDKPIDRLKEALSPTKKSYHRDFYALKNIHLTVRRGETVGLIGKNGAGKSTLLKIITGVASPTAGSVKLHGRISSLLELGTGFNPEYTGFENIYLHGALLGMTREEIDARRETILDFAEIGEFIHQPVKNYSSGMYVRLAFSVAINVDPDILIVDEALAVGDARFQAKCFHKINALKESGMTILFVSHDISVVKAICNRACLLHEGGILAVGQPKEVCIEYFKLMFPKEEYGLCHDELSFASESTDEKVIIIPNPQNEISFGVGGVKIEKLTLYGINLKDISGGEQVTARMEFSCDYDFVQQKILENDLKDNLISGISISNLRGEYLFGMTTYDKGVLLSTQKNHTYVVEYNFSFPYVASGDYLLNTAVALGTQENHIQLIWLEGLEAIKINSVKKYIYGFFYHPYTVRSE